MLGEDALDALFREGRSHNAWRDEPVSDETLREVYALTRMGPTSANSSPARFLFLHQRQRLAARRHVVGDEGRAQRLQDHALGAIDHGFRQVLVTQPRDKRGEIAAQRHGRRPLTMAERASPLYTEYRTA